VPLTYRFWNRNLGKIVPPRRLSKCYCVKCSRISPISIHFKVRWEIWHGFCCKFLGDIRVKIFWKSVNICQSYERMYSGTVFWLTVYKKLSYRRDSTGWQSCYQGHLRSLILVPACIWLLLLTCKLSHTAKYCTVLMKLSLQLFFFVFLGMLVLTLVLWSSQSQHQGKLRQLPLGLRDKICIAVTENMPI